MRSGNSSVATLLEMTAFQAGAPVELLAWDSEFWGIPIAQMRGNLLDATRLAAVDDFCLGSGVACLYFLAAADDPETTLLAEEAGFHLTDVRVTLRWRSGHRQEDAAARVGDGVEIRNWRDPDIPELRRIAGQSHQNTRFFADQRFSRERCPLLYETWIERSCAGYAERVLVALVSGRPVGYITCHLPRAADDAGRIGLIGIDRAARGQGIGAGLAAAALAWFARAGVSEVTVVTQGRNQAAIRLYERAGFLTDMVQLWYHKWYVPREGTF